MLRNPNVNPLMLLSSRDGGRISIKFWCRSIHCVGFGAMV